MGRKRRKQLKCNGQLGYSLIELVVVLVIIGGVTALILNSVRLYIEQVSHDKTIQHMQVVSETIQEFIANNGRYPCPAPLNLNINDSRYGYEVECDANSIYTQEEGIYDVWGNVEIREFIEPEIKKEEEQDEELPKEEAEPLEEQITYEKAKVRIGGIPVKSLGLDLKYANDGFGSRLTYAVTENMALSVPSQNIGGAIKIINEKNDNNLEGRGNASMVIVSHGKNKAGAYDKNGEKSKTLCFQKRLKRLDSENCDFDNAIFRNAQRTEHYDDYIFFSYNYAETKWQSLYNEQGDMFSKNTSLTTVSIGSINIAEDLKILQKEQEDRESNNEEKVIIINGEEYVLKPNIQYRISAEDGEVEVIELGPIAPEDITDPMLPKLEIDGDLKAKLNTNTIKICNKNLFDCFEPEILAGTGMRCLEPNHYPVGVGENKMKCENEVKCASGYYMIGINEETGWPLCRPFLTQCLEKNIEICGKTFTLPAVDEPYTYTVSSPFNRSQAYKCKANEWKVEQILGSCECVEQTREYTDSCPAGFSGKRYGKSKLFCNSPTSGEWLDLGFYEENCECKNMTQQAESQCSPGYVGKLIRERTHQCPEATWSDWVVIEDLCSRSYDKKP